ncbi:hypothetical protein BDV36DRAFT_277055 [Aspergillus pseudocaelatus]|uniref:Uncharacterized protein n=1 Tax=Aspergillus pseudocaelatus TaxID=1825620 RepID=A0ABQ6W0R8_9EURO|nr:hypothetical protein BDV36DRAFT_277055 [Aspergillus pseudocaelatus]
MEEIRSARWRAATSLSITDVSSPIRIGVARFSGKRWQKRVSATGFGTSRIEPRSKPFGQPMTNCTARHASSLVRRRH